jgi:hypothetical protein
MIARHLISVLALSVVIPVSANGAGYSAPPTGQIVNESPSSGRVAGSITPRAPSGFHIRLLIPTTTTEIEAKNSDADGNFALESIHPGTYQLDIQVSNANGGCAYLPWSKKITVRPGKTTTVKAKVQIKPGAVCE